MFPHLSALTFELIAALFARRFFNNETIRTIGNLTVLIKVAVVPPSVRKT